MNAMTRISTETLSGVPETLLIPLAARLEAARLNSDLGFVDPAAQQIGERLAFDPARFVDDRDSMRGSIVRALWFDEVTRDFLRRHPDGLVISIGSGLDTRANRIMPPIGASWVDVDFPEVAALRDKLVPPLPMTRNLAADGTNVASWSGVVDWHQGRPVLVLAEGVSMYLEPAAGARWVRDLVATAKRMGSSLTLALDLASPLMVRQGHRHPSVRKTGASFSWGVREPKTISQLTKGLALVSVDHGIIRNSGLSTRVFATVYRWVTGRPVYSCALYRTVGG